MRPGGRPPGRRGEEAETGDGRVPLRILVRRHVAALGRGTFLDPVAAQEVDQARGPVGMPHSQPGLDDPVPLRPRHHVPGQLMEFRDDVILRPEGFLAPPRRLSGLAVDAAVPVAELDPRQGRARPSPDGLPPVLRILEDAPDPGPDWRLRRRKPSGHVMHRT